MKKLIYSVAIICILASVLSCKSTKAGKKAGKKGEAPVTAEAEEALLPEAADGIAAAEGAEAQVEETGKKASKRKAKKNKKNAPKEDADYTGWKKSSKKNITERYGKVQLKIKPGIGSYTIATLNAKEKAVPVLSTSNEFVANAFYLKTSKKTYNLVTDNAVRSTARRTTDGAVITYEIPQVAQVNVFFTCFASQKKKDTDMVKISLSVKNTGKRNDDFSIKAILDTVLGESAPYHFYTWEDIPVKNEVLYRTLQNQKWFLSKNLNGAMQLFFTGADCTVPELVAFANYATLDNTAWEPDMLSYRVFDTVLSYNNSAVCAIWKPMKLAPDDIGKVTFYLALAAEGAQPTGEKYIYSKEFADEEVDLSEADKKGAATPLEVITPYAVDQKTEAAPVTEVTKVTENPVPVITAPEVQPEVPDVDYYLQNMSKEQLSPEYIQALLDRIAALEEDSPSLNRQELLQLNTELDAILTYLRQ